VKQRTHHCGPTTIQNIFGEKHILLQKRLLDVLFDERYLVKDKSDPSLLGASGEENKETTGRGKGLLLSEEQGLRGSVLSTLGGQGLRQNRGAHFEKNLQYYAMYWYIPTQNIEVFFKK